MGCKMLINGLMRTITTRKDGYQIYTEDGKSKYLHRYLAVKHIPNPNNLPMVNHIDGNKSNNSIENLEWVDALRNRRHAMENKLWGKNILDKRKFTDIEIIEIKQKYIPRKYSIHKLASEYKVDYKTIWSILNNKSYLKTENQYV
jgi:hypothetical protein